MSSVIGSVLRGSVLSIGRAINVISGRLTSSVSCCVGMEYQPDSGFYRQSTILPLDDAVAFAVGLADVDNRDYADFSGIDGTAGRAAGSFR